MGSRISQIQTGYGRERLGQDSPGHAPLMLDRIRHDSHLMSRVPASPSLASLTPRTAALARDYVD